LYREITFSRCNGYPINCLFLTILERPELALHIQSVVLDEGVEEDQTEDGEEEDQSDDGEEGIQRFDPTTCEWLLEHIIDVRELVRRVATPLQDVAFTLQWFGEIY
jgi:hypothetical protein